ncbi:hypothetical protein ACS0PU_001269 [Formica fusca]
MSLYIFSVILTEQLFARRDEISFGEIELNQGLTAAGINQRQLRCVNGTRASCSRRLASLPSLFAGGPAPFMAQRHRPPPSRMLTAACYYDSRPTRTHGGVAQRDTRLV